jgi:hypothetical protein
VINLKTTNSFFQAFNSQFNEEERCLQGVKLSGDLPSSTFTHDIIDDLIKYIDKRYYNKYKTFSFFLERLWTKIQLQLYKQDNEYLLHQYLLRSYGQI